MTRVVVAVAVAAPPPRACTRAPRARGCTARESDAARATPRARAHDFIAACASLALIAQPLAAHAQPGTKPIPVIDDPEVGCTVKALDLFSDVRAKFSMEVASGALPEAVLNLSRCDYSGKDLKGKVLSGIVGDDVNFDGVDFTGAEMSRASMRGSSFKNSVLNSVNAYEVRFDGSDMRGADFTNTLLSSASFGKYNGVWANVEGAQFEGALLSSSDAQRLCQNPTLDIDGLIAIGGCK